MLEPSGVYYGYSCCTAGKGRQIAKAQFEKNDFSKLTCEEALTYVAKIYIYCYAVYVSLMKKAEIKNMSMSWAGSVKKARTFISSSLNNS